VRGGHFYEYDIDSDGTINRGELECAVQAFLSERPREETALSSETRKKAAQGKPGASRSGSAPRTRSSTSRAGPQKANRSTSQPRERPASARSSTKPQEFDFTLSKRYPERQQRPQTAGRLQENEGNPNSVKPAINRASGPAEGADQRKRDSTSFFDRQVAWQREKEQKTARQRKQKEDSSLDGYTFQPDISQFGGPSQLARSMRDEPVSQEEAANRLYNDAMSKQKRDLESTKKKRKEEDDEIKRTCTFKPAINTYREGAAGPGMIKSRYRDGSPASRRRQPVEEEECTFQPQTNKVNPKMFDALKYLETDAFERLSNPPPSRTEGETSRATPRGNKSVARSSTPSRVKPGTPSARGSQTARSSSVTRERNDGGSFDAFLERQEQREAARKEKNEKRKEMLEPRFEPMLCKKSLELSARRGGDFLQRQEQEDKRKAHREQMRRRVDAEQNRCSFKPRISSKGQECRARSVDEMSTGDALKKEAMQEAMKLRAEQEEMREATFQPRIHANKGVQGRLKILSDPDTYIQRVQHNQLRQDQKLVEHQRHMEEEEMKECSFAPEIHDAPAYVKRIARSMALTRSTLPLPEESEAGWR